MDELRWFLLMVGIVVIAGIYGYGRWQEARRQGVERPRARAPRDGADIDAALRNLDASVGDGDPMLDAGDVEGSGPVWVAEPSLAPEPAAPSIETTEPVQELEPAAEVEPEHDEAAATMPPGLEQKVVVIHVAAADGRLYRGDDMAAALERAGLRFGAHRIFHWLDDDGAILFSAANMIEPGYFDMDQLAEMRGPGLALFLQLPAPFDGLTAFERMLETGRELAEMLDAALLDARRCDLTQQAIEHIREELREYRRRAHLKAREAQVYG